jgi:hypothetical protein
MTPERRTDIILLGALVVFHLSMGLVVEVTGESRILVWTASAVYLIGMIAIYWRFNRDRASILQTVSYWAVFLTLILTYRVALILEATDVLAALGVRLTVVVPVYLYWVASRD